LVFGERTVKRARVILDKGSDKLQRAVNATDTVIGMPVFMRHDQESVAFRNSRA
jgi:hypothetical protein